MIWKRNESKIKSNVNIKLKIDYQRRRRDWWSATDSWGVSRHQWWTRDARCMTKQNLFRYHNGPQSSWLETWFMGGCLVGTREGAGKNDSMEKDLIWRILFNVWIWFSSIPSYEKQLDRARHRTSAKNTKTINTESSIRLELQIEFNIIRRITLKIVKDIWWPLDRILYWKIYSFTEGTFEIAFTLFKFLVTCQRWILIGFMDT